MAKNNNLHKAKTAKNDEFYTQLTDIEKELKHYKNHFKDKTISVSYTHLRAHETVLDLVCRLLLEKKKTNKYYHNQ